MAGTRASKARQRSGAGPINADGRYQATVDLEKANDTKLAELTAGVHGVPIGVAPGTFEARRTLNYLEDILRALGRVLNEPTFAEADALVAGLNAEFLDTLEAESRKATIAAGAQQGAGGLDLSRLSDIKRRQASAHEGDEENASGD